MRRAHRIELPAQSQEIQCVVVDADACAGSPQSGRATWRFRRRNIKGQHPQLDPIGRATNLFCSRVPCKMEYGISSGSEHC